MWMILLLILLVFFLLGPILSVLFPLLLLFVPVFLFAGRPSIKVYTKTFDSSSLDPVSKNYPSSLSRVMPDVIDGEYTEHCE